MNRLALLSNHLAAAADDPDDNLASTLTISLTAAAGGNRIVRISDISIPTTPSLTPLKVPSLYLVNKGRGETQETIRALRFLAQKDSLSQDVYLIGPPGSTRRRLVKKYCELTRRAVEYVALSNDTTEADLKQRREISSGTARYVDCPATRAAIEGSVLILDGIEKAERNVLVVLNNLLENREMALEDGRFLCSPARYDSLLQGSTPAELANWRLVRTSERFRVVALGLPVPRYQGSTLDPPFRSRFQARDVQSAPGPQILAALAAVSPSTPPPLAKALTQAALVLREMREADGPGALAGLPEFPQSLDEVAGALWAAVPLLSPRAVADFCFPFPSLALPSDDRLHTVRKVFRRFGLEPPDAVKGLDDGLGAPSEAPPPSVPVVTSLQLAGVDFVGEHTARVVFKAQIEEGGDQVAQLSAREFPCECASGRLRVTWPRLGRDTSTPAFDEALVKMVLAHCSGGDLCVVGDKGCGKSHLVHVFARLLGYDVELVPLYKDVSARSLLQRRSTLSNGDTVWEDSPLVTAALTGRLCVLDGVEQMVPGTLATLQELILDRECRLPDGRHLVSKARLDALLRSNPGLDPAAQGMQVIHPSFRIVAVARPSFQGVANSALSARGAWLSPEVTGMFRFVYLAPVSPSEQALLLQRLFPLVRQEDMDRLSRFVSGLRSAVAKDDMLQALESTASLRQLIRVCRRLNKTPREDCDQVLRESLLAASLDRFLPPMAHDALVKLLDECDIKQQQQEAKDDPTPKTIAILPGDVLQVHNVRVPLQPARDALLVPSIVFFDNPRQTLMMADMLRDWLSGQHLLLIGNQGVGKNKLADRMLQLLRLPREYIQLHRDTTVANLTSNPTIVDGRLLYEDSPLVRAAREGRVLVVDEADKAPTYVTAVLKALVEDRSMLLSDGRRIIDADAPEPPDGAFIRLHPEFRVIALANRPGFPFLGNDFFREVGDVFACHAIDNPDAESELHLMREYGPSVPEDTLRRLIASFDELRGLSDSGKLNYPYSTRELAAVVRHLQRFPSDGIDRILRNVFDFDAYHPEERVIIGDVFAKHGIPFAKSDQAFVVSTGQTRALGSPRLVDSWLALRRERAAATVCSLEQCARVNHSNGTLWWTLRQPEVTASLQRVERSGQVFSEERYSFRLPRCSVLGACALEDGRLLVAGRAASFNIFIVNSDHTKCVGYDLFTALPADGTFKTTPRLASVVAMPQGGPIDAWVSHQEGGHAYGLDLKRNAVLYLEKLPGMIKGSRLSLVSAGEDRVAVFQKGEAVLGLIDGRNYSHALTPQPVRDVQALGNGQLLVFGDKGYTAICSFEGAALLIQPVRRQGQDAMRVSPRPSAAAVGGWGPGKARVAVGGGDVGFALGLPEALARGEQAHMYSVGAPGGGEVMALKGDLVAVRTEAPDKVEVDIVDLAAMRARRLVVPVEEDSTVGPAPPALGTSTPFSKPLTALSPADLAAFAMRRRLVNEAAQLVFLAEARDGCLVTIDFLGTCRVWFVAEVDVRKAFAEWRARVGFADEGVLQVQVDEGEGEGEGKGKGEGQGSGEGKGKGEGQGSGEGEGQGEGQGQGSGSGSVPKGGGAGTGRGKGKKFADVTELPDPDQFTGKTIASPSAEDAPAGRAVKATDRVVDDTARALKQAEHAEALKKIGMSEFDARKYEKYRTAVGSEIRELRLVLEGLESKEQERVWVKNASVGDLDEQKLIDGLTGERNIYMRRKDMDPDSVFYQPKPKKLSFVFDVSLSMSRYASDGRLERSLEAAVMVMEALKGFDRKFEYRITGHSGDTDELMLVPWQKPPANDKARLDVIKAMHAHAEMCDSGDNTLEAARKAVFDCAKGEADDRFVFLVSDANLDQYSITPDHLRRIFDIDRRVHVFVLFIASVRDSADKFAQALPGQVFVCLDKKDLPKVLKRMFLAATRSGL